MTEVVVRVLDDFGSWRKGDYARFSIEKAKVLIELGLVALEEGTVSGYISRLHSLLREQRNTTVVLEVDEGFYELGEFLKWYLEWRIRRAMGGSEIIQLLANLERGLRDFKALRFKVISDAARLRPGSLEIENRLDGWEKEFYSTLSRFSKQVLGGEGNGGATD